MNQDTNFSLVERARGNGPAIGQDELLDLLAELDAWRGAVEEYHVHSPEECAALVTELDANQENPDHADYDDLKEFFDDCQELIGCTDAWSSTEENAKRMIQELHEMNRQLGVE